jgi:hypothetical protein
MKKCRIKLSAQHLTRVREFANDGQKIKAIKWARTNGKSFPGKEELQNDGTTGVNHRPGLRETKHAVEHLMGQIDHDAACGVFAPALIIKKIIVEGETGNIEIDIDGLQLRCLDGLSQGIPLNEVASMTELVSFIRQWQGQDNDNED